MTNKSCGIGELIALLSLGGLGIVAGSMLPPVKIYSFDVNKDGLQDVIVDPSYIGPNHVFIQQPDGQYRNLKDIEAEMKDSTEARMDSIYKELKRK